MRFTRLLTMLRPHPAVAMAASPQESAPAGRHRVLWFIALWCAGVMGAVLLALPFRLLMDACMQ